jgi:dihydroorotase-like cyclic amidohydrolase
VLHPVLAVPSAEALAELPLLAAAERAAVERAVAICETTEAPVYIVHLSSRSAAEPGRGRWLRRGRSAAP